MSHPLQQATGHSKQLCRFYSQGRHCHYGKRCYFLHQKTASSDELTGLENRPNPGAGCEDEDSKNDALSLVPQQKSDMCGGSEKVDPLIPSSSRTTLVKQTRNHRPCRYFMSGFCSMEDRCRFWHPPVETNLVEHRQKSSSGAKQIPTALEQLRLADLTEEMSRKLRDTEIHQLMKRLSEDKLIVQEREDGQLTYYRVTVEASDPDWVKHFFINGLAGMKENVFS